MNVIGAYVEHTQHAAMKVTVAYVKHSQHAVIRLSVRVYVIFRVHSQRHIEHVFIIIT